MMEQTEFSRQSSCPFLCSGVPTVGELFTGLTEESDVPRPVSQVSKAVCQEGRWTTIDASVYGRGEE